MIFVIPPAAVPALPSPANPAGLAQLPQGQRLLVNTTLVIYPSRFAQAQELTLLRPSHAVKSETGVWRLLSSLILSAPRRSRIPPAPSRRRKHLLYYTQSIPVKSD
jgi:hypothetical protein